MFRKGGYKIKELRDCLGLTQQELADKTGVTRSSISNYEIGRREPESEFYLNLQENFCVSEKWIGEVVIEMAKCKKYAGANN